MIEENFRIVFYKTSAGTLNAQCLETGDSSAVGNKKKTAERVVTIHREILEHRLKERYSPFNPADKKIFELIRPGIDKPFKIIKQNIGNKYTAVFYCYDKTDILKSPQKNSDKSIAHQNLF